MGATATVTGIRLHRLDYCNSVLNGITDIENLFQRLQSVQNAAARLITQTGRREHITSVLRQLHMAACPTPCGIQAGRSHVQGSVLHRRTSPTTVCWWRKSVDVCDQLMHGRTVLYRGSRYTLVTGLLLWLVRGSGTVYTGSIA